MLLYLDYSVIQVFNGKNIRLVVSKSERWTNLFIWMFNDMFSVMSKETDFISCPSSHLFLVGWEWFGLKLKDCSKRLVSETETSSRLPVRFLVNLLSFHGKVFFTTRITKSGPKSRENSIALLETEVILTYFRLMVWKMRLEMIFRITVEANGKSTRLCQKCKFFLPFWAQAGVCLIVIIG